MSKLRSPFYSIQSLPVSLLLWKPFYPLSIFIVVAYLAEVALLGWYHGGDVGGCARRKNRRIILMRIMWSTESHAKE